MSTIVKATAARPSQSARSLVAGPATSNASNVIRANGASSLNRAAASSERTRVISTTRNIGISRPVLQWDARLGRDLGLARASRPCG